MSRTSSPMAASQIWTDELNPTHFFREKVLEAQERQRVKLSENVEFYLVTLLCDMMLLKEDGRAEDCLALILKKALASPHGEQVVLFKQLGDTALYFSGFFQEYFNRKCFDLSYYVSMGESAYGQLSNLMRQKTSYSDTMSKIYSEMSSSFSQSVDILVDVSEQTNHSNKERDLLGLYDAWLSTSSVKLEKDLYKRGINPIKVSKKRMQ